MLNANNFSHCHTVSVGPVYSRDGSNQSSDDTEFR